VPDRIPTFRPPWINRKPRARRVGPENRPNAAQRGYCSAGWKAARREVLLRDGNCCTICGTPVWGKRAHVDHIVAKRLGGGDEISNLRLLCDVCHARHEGWRAANEAMKTR
jgi:5-methylcytosine-specific restriction protein A